MKRNEKKKKGETQTRDAYRFRVSPVSFHVLSRESRIFDPVIKRFPAGKESRDVSRGSNSWQLTAPKKKKKRRKEKKVENTGARSGEFAISCSSEVLPQRFSPRFPRSPLSINTFLVCFPDPRFPSPWEWPSRWPLRIKLSDHSD